MSGNRVYLEIKDSTFRKARRVIVKLTGRGKLVSVGIRKAPKEMIEIQRYFLGIRFGTYWKETNVIKISNEGNETMCSAELVGSSIRLTVIKREYEPTGPDK
jgi:hypothetical protein